MGREFWYRESDDKAAKFQSNVFCLGQGFLGGAPKNILGAPMAL